MERSLSAIGSTGAVWPLYDLSLSLSVSVQVSLQLHSPVAPGKKKKKKSSSAVAAFSDPEAGNGLLHTNLGLHLNSAAHL